MTGAALFSLILIVLMVIALAFDFMSPDFVLFLVLVILILFGIVTPSEALSGFANKGMLTVAALFVVSKSIENTGAINIIAEKVLSKNKEKGISKLMLRMMFPVSILSAFLNNTPIVMMFAPMVKKWADNLSLPAKKFLIPLSYATIFGGLCTLIGTSTNLVVHGLMLEYDMPGLGMFELAAIGIPSMIIGLIYLSIVGKRFLPQGNDNISVDEERKKEFMIEMIAKKHCSLIGKTVKETGLYNLKGIFEIKIFRKKEYFDPEKENIVIKERDRLIIFGTSEAILEINSIPQLIPVSPNLFKKNRKFIPDQLIETVISPQSPFLGKFVRQCEFERIYGAEVVAIHRNGERIAERLRNVRLQVGDALLIQTEKDFIERHGASQDFYLVSHVKTVFPESSTKTLTALIILILMILGATLGNYLPEIGGEKPGMLHFAFAAVIFLLLTKCVKLEEARRSVKVDVLITIASAFGIAAALQQTGAAAVVAKFIINIVDQWGAIGALAGVWLLTNIFTEVVTNNAAAAMMVPIAYATANQLGVDPRPFFIAVAVAASSSFATPIGYQTNLIVQGIGGYKFKDYLKIGLPLNILIFILSMIIIPLVWKF